MVSTSFFFFLSFFLCLLPAIADWMSTILPHMWPYCTFRMKCAARGSLKIHDTKNHQKTAISSPHVPWYKEQTYGTLAPCNFQRGTTCIPRAAMTLGIGLHSMFYIYRAMYIFRTVVSCTVCGNQEVVGSNPIAPLMGVVAQLAERLI